MADYDFFPEEWTTQQGIILRKNMVGGMVTNRNFDGAVVHGKTVNVWTPGAITGGTYTANTGFSTAIQIPDDTEDTLVVDQTAAYRFYVDKITKVQGALDPTSGYNTNAAYTMANTIDTAIFSLASSVASGNIVYPAAAVTSSTILGLISDLAQVFDTNNIPKEGRYITLSARGWRLLKDALGGRATDLGDKVLLSGALTMVDGFNIFMSNNTTVTTGAGTGSGTGSKVVHQCLAGVTDGITLAYAIPPSYVEISKITGKAGTDSLMGRAVEGMAVYGVKMWNSGALNGMLNLWWDS